MKRNKLSQNKSKSQIAYEMYEHVFVTLKNDKAHESNRHPAGHPDRIEHDFSEGEKEHLALLRANVERELANEARESQEKLSGHVWWLNAALVLLSGAMVIAALFELFQ